MRSDLRRCNVLTVQANVAAASQPAKGKAKAMDLTAEKFLRYVVHTMPKVFFQNLPYLYRYYKDHYIFA